MPLFHRPRVITVDCSKNTVDFACFQSTLLFRCSRPAPSPRFTDCRLHKPAGRLTGHGRAPPTAALQCAAVADRRGMTDHPSLPIPCGTLLHLHVEQRVSRSIIETSRNRFHIAVMEPVAFRLSHEIALEVETTASSGRQISTDAGRARRRGPIRWPRYWPGHWEFQHVSSHLANARLSMIQNSAWAPAAVPV